MLHLFSVIQLIQWDFFMELIGQASSEALSLITICIHVVAKTKSNKCIVRFVHWYEIVRHCLTALNDLFKAKMGYTS